MAVSGLEMRQNSVRIAWKEADLQRLLVDIVGDIDDRCAEYGGTAGSKAIDYVRGANIAGFKKVADACWPTGWCRRREPSGGDRDRSWASCLEVHVMAAQAADGRGDAGGEGA